MVWMMYVIVMMHFQWHPESVKSVLKHKIHHQTQMFVSFDLTVEELLEMHCYYHVYYSFHPSAYCLKQHAACLVSIDTKFCFYQLHSVMLMLCNLYSLHLHFRHLYPLNGHQTSIGSDKSQRIVLACNNIKLWNVSELICNDLMAFSNHFWPDLQ